MTNIGRYPNLPTLPLGNATIANDLLTTVPAVLNRGIHDIMPNPNGVNTKLLAMGRGEYNKATDDNFSLNPFNIGGLPDSLQGHLEPGYGPFSRASIAASEPFTYAKDLNEPIPISRILSNSESHLIPGENQIAFLCRSSRASDSKDAILAWHLAALNKYLCEQCAATARDYPDQWAELTPQIVWFGYTGQNERKRKAYKWCGFTCDGAVRIEQTVDNQSSTFSDGYGRGYEFIYRPVPTKAVSIVREGNCETIDEWNGRGLDIMASVGFMLTKKVTGATHYEYVLSGKSEVLTTQGRGVVEIVEVPSQQQYATSLQALRATNALIPAPVGPVCPFQLFPLAIRDGGSPSSVFREYVDEHGMHQHNAHHIKAGNVVFEPRESRLSPTIPSPSSGSFVATNAALSGYTNMRLTVAFNTSKDGMAWE